MIGERSQDPWVYWADWAFYSANQKKGAFDLDSQRQALALGRIGYRGRANPDLKR